MDCPDLTIETLARIVQKHPETLRKLARQGRLHGAYRLAGRGAWRIRSEAVAELRGEKAAVEVKQS